MKLAAKEKNGFYLLVNSYRMLCPKMAEIDREYEAAMREMNDASPRLAASNLTDIGTRLVAARKAWIEHRQTCPECKGT